MPCNENAARAEPAFWRVVEVHTVFKCRMRGGYSPSSDNAKLLKVAAHIACVSRSKSPVSGTQSEDVYS
eukprot:4512957-Pleurochrysis_carterae.AAC.1